MVPPKSLSFINLRDGSASKLRRQKLNRQFVKSCDQRNNFFTNRIIPNWNLLPLQAIEAKTTNQFKNIIAIAGFCQLHFFIGNK